VTWEPYAGSTVWNTANSYLKLDVVNNNGDYYRALQDVPVGTAISNILYWFEFVPAQQSLVDFGTDYGATDGVAIVVFGTYTVDAGNFVIGKSYTITIIGTTDWVSIGAASATVGVSFVATGTGTGTGQASSAYSWSTPQTQIVIVDADTAASKNITMTNSVQGSNPANAVVTRNGLRLRPPAAIEWIGDDSTVGSYPLPQRLGFSQSLIFAPSEVSVWVDNILQIQTVGPTAGTYTVTAVDGEYEFSYAKTNADINFNAVIPHGTTYLSGFNAETIYAADPAVYEAIIVISVEVFQSINAAGGQIEGIDFQPTPYRMGRSLLNRVIGILGKSLDTGAMLA
jgi:hypothetical protein